MNRERSGWVLPVLLILSLALIAGGIWANLRIAETAPGGNEFFVNWYSLRAWFTQGTSPYNSAVRLETEMLVYGHPAQADEPRLVFSAPLYSAMLISPFALISEFTLARAFWMMTLELALLATVILGARLARWSPSRLNWGLLIVVAWLGFFSIHSVLSGSSAALTGLFLMLGLSALQSERLEAAGVMFALATGFGQGSILLIVFTFLWAITNRKGRMAAWLLATIVFLSFIGMFFIRDWPLQYARSVLSFAGEQAFLTPGDILSTWLPGIGGQVSWGLTILLGLVLIVEWFLMRGQAFRWFYWTACLTLVFEPWIGLPTRLSAIVLLLPALILVLANWEQRLGKFGYWLAAGSLLLLTVGLWALARDPILGFGMIGDISLERWGMLFPLPLFLIIGLYWVRWWAVRPPRMFLDELRSAGH